MKSRTAPTVPTYPSPWHLERTCPTQLRACDEEEAFYAVGHGSAAAYQGAATLLRLAGTRRAIIQRGKRGREFQTSVTNAFGLPRNTKTMLGELSSGSLEPTIPDVYGGGQTPIGDIKDYLRLYDSPQLKAQRSVAAMTGVPHALIVGPRNKYIHPPLATATIASGGFVFRADPTTRTVEVFDVASGEWLPFLGGRWDL
jgi:hypothetical protein